MNGAPRWLLAAALVPAASALAHGGAPLVVAVDKQLGALGVTVSVWVDPDVGGGEVLVGAKSLGGGGTLDDLTVEVELAPADAETATLVLHAHADGQGEARRFKVEPPFPSVGLWRMRVRGRTSRGEGEASFEFDVTRPGLGTWDLALYFFPFALFGGLAALVGMRRRATASAAGSSASNGNLRSGGMPAFLHALTLVIVNVVMKVDSRLIQRVRLRRLYRASSGAIRQIYEQVRSDVGFADCGIMAVASTRPDLLAAFATLIRENYFGGAMDRAVKEAIGATLSAKFGCRYCFGMHTMFLDALCDAEVGAAIARRQFGAIADEAVRRHVVWADRVLDFDDPSPVDSPIASAHEAEVLGLLAASATIGRVAKIYLGRSPLFLNQTLGMRLLLRILRPGIRRLITPIRRGALFAHLPDAAPAASELPWTQGDPVMKATFSRCAAVFATVLGEHLTLQERERIGRAVGAWLGKDPPLGRAWLAPYLSGIAENRRDQVAFALLVAAAPDRILKADFPVQDGGEVGLYIATWVSFQVGLEIVSRVAARRRSAADAA